MHRNTQTHTDRIFSSVFSVSVTTVLRDPGPGEIPFHKFWQGVGTGSSLRSNHSVIPWDTLLFEMRKHAAKEHCFFSQRFKNDNNCFCLILVFMLQADGKSMRKKEIHVIWAWGLHKWHCTKGLLLPNSHPDRAEWSPTGRNKPSSKFCGTGTVSLMTYHFPPGQLGWG